ncbi:MAG TPA: polysaccharide deacetylase family protein [Geodermatophilus sp.]|nr:polysaccharide deacetylase family protein [Geodermatophilus sp.]
MPTRRTFLAAFGAGAAGLLTGAAAGPLYDGAASPSPASGDERRGATGDFGAPLRIGAHRVVWSLPATANAVAITFDDGPTETFTPRVLDALAAAGATATFYVLGASVVASPTLVREVVAAGHEIGNHTWSHRDLTRLSLQETRDQITRCAHTVEDLTGRPAVGFRPPRGELTGYALRVCAELGYDVHMWSCTRGPGDDRDPAAVAAYVGRTAAPGDVVGLHDGIGRGTFHPQAAFARRLTTRREVEVRGLPDLLARLGDRGLSVVSVGRLAAADPSET